MENKEGIYRTHGLYGKHRTVAANIKNGQTSMG